MKIVLHLSAVLLLGVSIPRAASGTATNEFAQVLACFGKIHTIAGLGQVDSNGGNDWMDTFEGSPARDAELSEAHNAQADVFGNVYIVDKDAHAIRKVTTDGTIHTIAGNNVSGNGSDETQPGTQCLLRAPNGLYVQPDGTCFIYDVGNRKVRRLGTNGEIATVFTDSGMSGTGRGLWVSADATVIYYSSGAEVRAWNPTNGSHIVAGGFSGGLANLTVDPQGQLVVTDRNAHSVYRVDADGTKTRIAGNGSATGGGDGEPATETGLEEVRGIAFAPTGGFFVCTHRGSDVWFIDSAGIAHLFINGVRNSSPYSGEGTLPSSEGVKLSEVRAINITPGGDLIITQSDESTIRIVENVCPPTVGPLRAELDSSRTLFTLRWLSPTESSYLETTPNLVPPTWRAVAIAGPSAEGGVWTDPAWRSKERAYFRVRAATRWPAP